MARPITRKVKLKDGFYIAVKPKYGDHHPIKISRRTKREVMALLDRYSRFKNVSYLGEVRDGDFVAA